jgi:hypothetical protein
MAIAGNDTALVRRLRQQIQRNFARATEFDRMEQELWDVYYAGERERSAALARGLVRRYPRDPRAYDALRSILLTQGDFDEAERVAVAGPRARSPPCAPDPVLCAMHRLLQHHHPALVATDSRGAAAWSQRWIAEQPDAPSAYTSLAWTLSYAQKPDSALLIMHQPSRFPATNWSMEQYARCCWPIVVMPPPIRDQPHRSVAPGQPGRVG